MQTALTYRTNRDLFSNYYLDEHVPETNEWDELSDAELRDLASEDQLRSEYYGEKSQQLVDVHTAAESFLDGPDAAYNGIQHLDEITPRTDWKSDYRRRADEAIDEFERYEETVAAIETHPSLDDGLENATESARDLQEEADSLPDECGREVD